MYSSAFAEPKRSTPAIVYIYFMFLLLAKGLLSLQFAVWFELLLGVLVMNSKSLDFWIGVQGTVPYEQKIQQSPCFGLSNVAQLLHFDNRWNVSAPFWAHSGDVIVDSKITFTVISRIFCLLN